MDSYRNLFSLKYKMKHAQIERNELQSDFAPLLKYTCYMNLALQAILTLTLFHSLQTDGQAFAILKNKLLCMKK